MGCLNVKIRPLRDYTVNVRLVCTANNGWEKLLCFDMGEIETFDKGYLMIKKSKNGI